MKIVVIGGGAAGLGVAGAAKGQDPSAQTVVYTEYEDVAYSPCGIPFVHGKEIESFEKLFLATKERTSPRHRCALRDQRREYRPQVADHQGQRRGRDLLRPAGPRDRLEYATPDIPGAELGGIYHVKNIRAAMEWDRYLDR